MSVANKWAVRSVYLLACALGIWSVSDYQGSKLILGFYSAIIFAIGYFAVRFPSQYSHFFLGLAWFVGFWAKFVFHQSTGRPYYEMSGSFDGSNASWDAVFLVIGVGGAGYLAGRVLSLLVAGPQTTSLLKRTMNAPRWWASYRNLGWLTAALLVAATVATNQEFGILVRGYVAQVVLPWPLGGLFAWMTDIGLALLLALLMTWDRQSGFGVVGGFVALCIEGALVSVSTLSRGVYFFHTVPPLATEGVDAVKRGKRRSTFILFAIWGVVGVAIPSAATFLRLFGSDAAPITQADLTTTQARLASQSSVTNQSSVTSPSSVTSSSSVTSQSVKISRPMFEQQTVRGLWNQFVTMAQLLVIDRWTGLEGVMATVAYAGRSQALLVEAAAQRRSYGTVDVYTRKISGSTFTEVNAKKYHFATLAGPIAFLYFSGSLVVVFFGMALIAVLMSATELLWWWLVCDRLLVAMSGLYLALIVLQLSGGVVQAGTGPVTVTGAFAAIWLVGRMQSRRLGVSEMTQTREPSCSGN